MAKRGKKGKTSKSKSKSRKSSQLTTIKNEVKKVSKNTKDMGDKIKSMDKETSPVNTIKKDLGRLVQKEINIQKELKKISRYTRDTNKNLDKLNKNLPKMPKKVEVEGVEKLGETNSVLSDNFISLQKTMTKFAERFDNLSKEISTLLKLFESAAKSMIEQGDGGEKIPSEDKEELLEKLNKLFDQNKIIARGITLVEEKMRDKLYPQKNPGHQFIPNSPNTSQATKQIPQFRQPNFPQKQGMYPSVKISEEGQTAIPSDSKNDSNSEKGKTTQNMGQDKDNIKSGYFQQNQQGKGN